MSFIYSKFKNRNVIINYDFNVIDLVLFSFSCIIIIPIFFIEFSNILQFALCLLSILLSSYKTLKLLFLEIINGQFLSENICLITAMISELLYGQYLFSALIGIFYQLIKIIFFFIRKKVVDNSYSILDMIPNRAAVVSNDDIKKIKPSNIKNGDIIVVDKNELIPIDGIVVDGISSINMKLIYGEDEINNVKPGSKVLSGSMNMSNRIVIEATCDYCDSNIRILYDEFQASLNNDCEIESKLKIIFNFSQFIVICIFIVYCIVIPIFSHDWLSNLNWCSIILLLITPFGLLSAEDIAVYRCVNYFFENGAVINNRNVLDKLYFCDTFISNKTGTLTENEYKVVDVCSQCISEYEFLSIACKIESGQNHPIKEALYEYCAYDNIPDHEFINTEYIQGKGLKCTVGNNEILFGNASLFAESNFYNCIPATNGLSIHLAINSSYCGYLVLENKIRKNIYDSFESLRANGIKSFVLLSCDLRSIVRPIALALNFNNIKAELTTKDKIKAVAYLKDNLNNRSTMIYVGNKLDEISCSKNAHISVGTSLVGNISSIKKFDISFLGDGISSLSKVFCSAKATIKCIRVNLYISIITRFLLLVLLLLKIYNLVLILGVLLLVGCICGINSTIILKRRIY